MNKIAQLKAEQLKAEQDYYDGTLRMEKEIASIDEEKVKRAKEAAKVRLAIERELQDALIELDDNETRKEVLKAKVAGEREVEDLRLRLENLKTTDKKGRDELQKLIVAKEQETQQKINQIVFAAAAARSEKEREYAAKSLALGETNAIKLAQIEVQRTESRYSELAALDQAQKKALYESDEDYYAELQAAEAEWIAAGNALLLEQYNERQLAQENRMNEELIKVQEDEVAKTEIQLRYAQERYDELLNLDQKTKALLYSSEEQYKQAVLAAEAEMRQASKATVQSTLKDAKNVASAISGAMGSLSSVLDEFSEQNAEAARASKAIALGKIAVETGIAIATGTAQAMDLPFPANLAAIVTTVATVLANIATAISTVKGANFGGKFAEGGFIPGNSYTGDRMVARVNSGEAVLTPQQQQNFMNLANTPSMGFDMNAFADVLVAAVAAQPAPVMDYSEFTNFQQKVSTYNEIARI